MTYRSCVKIQRFFLNLAWRIDTGEKCIRFCTEPLTDTPGVPLQNTAEESLKSIAKLRTAIIAESKTLTMFGRQVADEERNLTSECAKCSNAELKDWGESDGLIHYVNMSMEPAPCQCRCFYCDVKKKTVDMQQCDEGYEKVFDLINFALRKELIAADAKWQVSSNEITIHPYRERIFDIIKGRSCNFYTNCFIYDEGIAENLAENPRSTINLSIDCGTPETWFRVKGVDNFDTVRENLAKYSGISLHPEQITLKYIVFPGINDDLGEYRALAAIMKELKVSRMTISCDLRGGRNKYSVDKAQREPLIRAAGRLAAVLYSDGLTVRMSENGFFPDEALRVEEIATELIESGKVS